MIYKIAFQNNLTGEVWDLAPVVKSFNLSSKRSGTPTKLEVELLSGLEFPDGSRLALTAGSHKLFYGYLFRVRRSKNGRHTLTFFDQKKYLLRTESYVFQNSTLANVITSIAKDYELKVGKLVGPSVKMPTVLKEEKTALDIIEESIDQVFVQTGELTVFWDDYGELRLDYPRNLAILTILGEGSIVADFEYERSIEDSANIVKLLHEDGTSGKRTMYHFRDSNNIKKWGKLQYFKVVDENLNAAQINSMGLMMIELKNKPKETIKLSMSVGDFDFEAGRSAYVDLPDIKVKGWFLLEAVDHKVTASSHTMEIELWLEGGSRVKS